MSRSALLALETSTDACSVALKVGDRVAQRRLVEPRAHAVAIMPMIDDVLDELSTTIGELDGIVYGRGPGSFTGLRIAVALAQGLALGAQLPVLGISSLRVVAQQALDAHTDDTVLVLQDARMHEVYAGAYRRDAVSVAAPVAIDALMSPHDLALHRATLVIGNACAGNPDVARWVGRQQAVFCDAHALPFAETLLRLADGADAADWTTASEATAVYLRNTVASVPDS